LLSIGHALNSAIVRWASVVNVQQAQAASSVHAVIGTATVASVENHVAATTVIFDN
jgi:hypothetical protein